MGAKILSPRFVAWEKSEPPNEVEAEAKLSTEGFSCFRWNDAPGELYPNHRHLYDECLWVIRGEMEIATAGTTYLLKPGDRIYLPANIGHTLMVTHPTGVIYLVGMGSQSLGSDSA